MNKFLTATSVVLLASTGYLAYRVYELTHQGRIGITNIPDKSCSSFPYDYSKGDFEGIINYETAKTLYDVYNRKKQGIAEYKDGIFVGGEDSRNIWFSLDRLKNFIWHIEEQYCKNGCADSLGLRIYFGRYPNLVEHTDGSELGLDNVPKEYSNRLTLFMVPTYKKDNGSNLYYDFHPGGTGCGIPLISSPIHSIGAELNAHDISPFIFLFDVTGAPSNSQNHGGLIPPGDSTGTGF